MRHPLLDLDGHPVFAHRGASESQPENSLAAFEVALAEGADGLEFDVRLSRDGVPVVVHDPTLDRTTRGSGPVAALDADDLGRLGVPTVAEVLRQHRSVPILIELKVANAAGPVLRLLEGREPREAAVLASFLEPALVPCRAAGMVTSASRRGIVWLALLAALGLPAPAVRDAMYCVPVRYKDRIPVPTRRFVAAARRSGRPVHAWTVNDPLSAHRLWDLGVAGVITNRPGAMVAERNQRFGTDAGPATDRRAGLRP